MLLKNSVSGMKLRNLKLLYHKIVQLSISMDSWTLGWNIAKVNIMDKRKISWVSSTVKVNSKNVWSTKDEFQLSSSVKEI